MSERLWRAGRTPELFCIPVQFWVNIGFSSDAMTVQDVATLRQ
jgi:hypothetical protein